MIHKLLTHAVPLAAVAAFAAGCNNETAAPTDAPAGEHAAHAEHGADGEHAAHEHGGGHEHATAGPHGGDLIDLGDHEYLAELVHDESSVTVYLLEHDGTTPVPTDAQEITISLMHDGQPEQFPLTAAPEPNDPEGQSSKFTIESADLAGHLDEEGAQPQLMATINGTPYSAAIAHHHGHDHGHEGHGHEGHEH